MSVQDRERYARDRERIRARQRRYAEQHREKWREARLAKYSTEPIRQTKSIYRSMINRCTNPKADAYKYYGAEGITVCQRWLESFDAFLADVGMRPPGMELDRIEGCGPYAPGNVRWATRSEQMQHRRLPLNSIPSCTCGTCKVCRNREAVKRYREKRRTT